MQLANSGKHLESLHGAKPFRLKLRNGRLYFVPGSRFPRPIHSRNLKLILQRYEKLRSLHPSDYGDITFHSSYYLAVLADMERR